MHKSHAFGGVDDATLLGCLNSWPPGTAGAQQDEMIIRTLNDLCKKHGYGYIPQLAKMIEEVWRDPAMVEKYQKMNAERHEMMLSTARLVLGK